MKRMLFVLMALWMVVGLGKSNAQVIDVSAGTDMVELHAGNYQYGLVQWQMSNDTVGFENIEGANDTVYRFLPIQNAYYRALVTFSNCPPVYSPICHVVLPPTANGGPSRVLAEGEGAMLYGLLEEDCIGEWAIVEGNNGYLESPHSSNCYFFGTDDEYKITWTVTNASGSATDTIIVRYVHTEYNENYAIVDTTDLILSNPTQLYNGYYIVKFSDTAPHIEDSTILIGIGQPGFFRKIVDFEVDGDVYHIHTVAASLSDLIPEGAFSIDYSTIDPSRHNRKVVNRFPTRKELMSEEFQKGEVLYIREEGDGRSQLDDVEGYLSFSFGNISLSSDDLVGPNIPTATPSLRLKKNFIIDWERQGLHVNSFKFGFYNSVIERDLSVNIPVGNIGIDLDKKIDLPVVFNIYMAFMLGPIPVSICLHPSIYVDLSASFNLSTDFTYTQREKLTFTKAIEYENREWKKQSSQTENTVREASVNAGSAEFDFFIGPRLDFWLYDVFEGLFFTVGPYLNYKVSAVPNNATRLQGGGRFTVGLDHKFFGFDFGISASLNAPVSMFENPHTLLSWQGNHQSFHPGEGLPLPLKVQALTSTNMPAVGTQVRFEAFNGYLQNSSALTDANGMAQVEWYPNTTWYGSATAKAYLYNADGQPVEGSPVVFTAYEAAPEVVNECQGTDLSLRLEKENWKLVITPSGGEPPYSYSTDGLNFSETKPTIDIHTEELYTIFVKDSRGCVEEADFYDPPINCYANPVQIEVTQQGNTIVLGATGGEPPYKFSNDGQHYSSNNVFENLPNGDYAFSVMDQNTCSDEVSVSIEMEDQDLTVRTLPVEVTDEGYARLYGEYQSYDGAVILRVGFCIATEHAPSFDNYTFNSSGVYSPFNFTIFDGIVPGVTYYVRAYAVSQQGVSWGNEESFMTTTVAQLPEVATYDAVNVNTNSATLGGYVSSDGGAEITLRGVCYGPNHNPDLNGSYIAAENNGLGGFQVSVEGLEPNSTYYFRAFAVNSAGTCYGAEKSFITSVTPPVINAPEGALNGLFTVNVNNRQVYFSKGNLQFMGSETPQYWKFADRQWDYFGDNGQEDGNSNQNRDLFCWGTSGYDHGAVGYQPWSTYSQNNYYYAYGDKECDLFDHTRKADWGYNAIRNGGNQEGLWRTMTRDEWMFLMDSRVVPSGIRYAKAIVNEVNGIIILPDDWDDSYYSLRNPNSTSVNYSTNRIAASDWDVLESHGAVFLPAAGVAYHGNIEDAGSKGFYWSSSHEDDDNARSLYFTYSWIYTESFYRSNGSSVRLVQDKLTPEVTFANPEVGEITATSAVINGEVYCDLPNTIIDKGICWSTSPNPTIGGQHLSCGTGAGQISQRLLNLASGTRYYVRLYATNETGTEYSDEAVFNTQKNWPNGVLPGRFSVSESEIMQFSQGNLKYQASTNTWRFHDNQYDIIGYGNENISPDYEGWIDLFGWGTSGNNHGANCYQPWSTQQGDANYYAYGSLYSNLDDYTGEADWGHNVISNGGDSQTLWHTLTNSQLSYLLFTRNTVSGMRFAFANISGHLGLLLLPDEWNPEIYLLNDVNNTESVFSSNEITLDDWDVLESNGVVFLPAAGLREYVNATGYVNEAGYYWTATLDDTFYKPINLRFGNNHSDNNRSSGNSVRLLCYSSALVEEVTVTTQPNVICTPTSIQGGGSVIVPDGVVVSDKGLCYSLNANPTMSDGYVSAGMGSGVFTATITNLTPSTSYHIRAYAVTDNGVYYGSDLMATTMEADNVPEGAINGKFSVDATHKVYFSQGNLQYKATTNTWRFAENQWDAMGSQNQFIAENYDGWIDLFGWGTSGYNHGAVCYQPWSVAQSNTDYMAYGDLNADLYDGDGTADWGYNVISNGGGEENLWRTLTADEFYYLLQDRPGVRYARATVNGVAGLILLPDNWSTSVYSFNEPNVYDAAFNSNVISSDTWLLLEGNGAVFLPIAGERNFTSVNTNNGAYWSSQAGVEALYLAIDNYGTGVNGMSRYRGLSVRLVRNVE